ncbi:MULTISPECIES: gentisate 1,2-dioxygenase [unclassified Novosphingobium]|uniref:gentisate 1,2-dioxygenase n=1 Tax=unclassified Novosphingobium TaxID=2644732 RepID=UPI000869AC38|nr:MULTISPECIES: gentisate 1,2-dioxygenase [unclassified Novosphingobium]MBN9142286.1 gentisate 1,2-dioxygenase [Novosphingobium sp.]MDR6710325.1 gentisate 1,2-dioxygenase [Novosphingobium sp. 1748]ODU78595.1 MAG: gentisate 1,2-dioxygenase [Novosphingobium sp. SCN 63-17]OJX90526.1 MAG: gentisate 1,2-dioxygenase [Novosphingobium sp. 63-713]
MTLANEQQAQLHALYDEMAPSYLTPLWESLADLVRPFPRSAAHAHRWNYDEARNYLMRAGDLISAEKAERRVLILENPGLPGQSAITPSLYAGLQLILPGEVAPCHRHSQSALRFVMEGEGAFTALDGEKAIMRPFDLVLTPGGQWHDHGNPSDKPMIWLDGLDIPTVRLFDAQFAEHYDGKAFPESAPAGDTLARYGHNMRPMRGTAADRRPAHQPLFHYPYAQWRPALDALAASGDIDPHMGHALEFTNPADGGPIMPTIAAHVRLIPAGFATKPRKSSDGTIFVVVEGSGTAKVGDTEINLSERDVFAVPSWSELVLQAGETLVLFAYSDKASQEKLNLYREWNS